MPHLADTASPHPVRIVLESEAASAYCAKTKANALKLERGDEFMVADIGGGTTDIVVHTKDNDGDQDLKLKEAVQSSGDVCGGTHVDANFLNFLRAKVGGAGFDDVVSTKPAIITSLQKRWSHMKASFNGDENWEQSLDLPTALKKAWKSHGTRRIRSDDDASYDEMEFTVSDMKEIFDPVVDRVIQLIQEAMTPRVKLLLLLVGGFSASPYLRDKVRAALADRLGDKIVMPPDPGSAVCQGAVLFGFSPDLVISRVARKTYGMEIRGDFDSQLDPLSKRVWTDSRGWRCNNRFQVFVTKGQHVGVDESFSISSCPSEEDQTSVTFGIHSTDAKEVRYTTEPGVVLEGKFTMDISKDPENLDLNRKFETTMFFGTSCIRVQA